MQTLDSDEVTVHIDAHPDVVYDLVADVTRTPEFSPEVIRCEWLDGATGPVVGARFKATNKVPNRPPWHNTPVVIVADPGRGFAFSRTERLAGTIVWRYRLEPERDGTRVTESYEVVRPVTRHAVRLVHHRHAVRRARPSQRPPLRHAGDPAATRRGRRAARRGRVIEVSHGPRARPLRRR